MARAEGNDPAASISSSFGDWVATFFQAIAFGAVAPYIYFVNDLSHPSQTVLLTSLFFVGRLIGKTIFSRFSSWGLNRPLLAVQGIMLTLAYALIAESAALYPTGITGLRFAQVGWFLVGLLGSHLFLRKSYFKAEKRFSMIDFDLLGISIGAALSSALTWGIVRSPVRWALMDAFVPSIVAAGLSAIAVGVLLMSRRHMVAFENESLHKCGSVSAIIICAVAVPCALGPMMLWESFGFRPCEVALMIANAGLLAVAVQIIVRRALDRSGSATLCRWVIAIGLCSLFVSANALSWSPNTGSGIVLCTGIALLSIGWGCLRPMLSDVNGNSDGFGFTLDARVWLVAWLCGMMLGASLFYYHERTSFASSGLVIVVAAFMIWKREIDKACTSAPVEQAAQTETTRESAASLFP